MNDLICESAHWRSEVRVEIEAESEVPLVYVEIARVNSVLLDVHGLVDQKLFEAIVQLFLFKQFFELLLQVHHVVRLELDSEVRDVAVEMLQVAVKRLGMVDDEAVGPKVPHELLGDFVIRHNHKLFDQFLSLDPFLQANIDWHSL